MSRNNNNLLTPSAGNAPCIQVPTVKGRSSSFFNSSGTGSAATDAASTGKKSVYENSTMDNLTGIDPGWVQRKDKSNEGMLMESSSEVQEPGKRIYTFGVAEHVPSIKILWP